jgi:hypothetical protein
MYSSTTDPSTVCASKVGVGSEKLCSKLGQALVTTNGRTGLHRLDNILTVQLIQVNCLIKDPFGVKNRLWPLRCPQWKFGIFVEKMEDDL